MSSTDGREQGTSETGGAACGGSLDAGAARITQTTGGRPGRRRYRGRWVGIGAATVVLAVVAGTALAAVAFGAGGPPATAAGTVSGYRTSTATVTRQSLTSQTDVDATLGNAGSWSVVVPQAAASSSLSASAPGGSGTGIFTWLPAAGHTLRQGRVAYAVSGAPVVLLYGQVPAYRDLSEGLAGADVTELNTDLVKLGYVTRATLGPRSGWDYYSAETAYAVGLLQAKLGLTVTGTLSLGEGAFLPGPALVTSLGSGVTLGGPATPGGAVLTATSTTPVVTIALDPGQQSEVKNGDPVAITIPDGRSTPGVITQIIRVASSSSSGGANGQGGASNNAQGGSSSSGATITVQASLIHPSAAEKLNGAPVSVTITTGSVANVLTVPVDALLAQAGGGTYDVEVAGPGGHHLVPVTVGLFDDAAGKVQVTSPQLAAGQQVVVPGI
jgi:hypothetical protein